VEKPDLSVFFTITVNVLCMCIDLLSCCENQFFCKVQVKVIDAHCMNNQSSGYKTGYRVIDHLLF